MSSIEHLNKLTWVILETGWRGLHAPDVGGPLSVGFADLELLGVLCLDKSVCSDSGSICLECFC